MKKEKTVRTYQRRTKSGKMVTVRQHTAKYDAADKMKEALKKKGAGDEFETRKKKLAMEQLAGKGAAEEFEKTLGDDALKENEKVKEGKKTRASKKSEKVSSKKESRSSKKETKSDQPFTAAEFKEWYEGTGSAADKKVAKALRKSLGRKAYNELSDLAADNYKKGGASSFFKKNVHSKVAKEVKPKTSELKANAPKKSAQGLSAKDYGNMHLATLKKNYSEVSKQEKAATSKSEKKALQKDIFAMNSELRSRGYLVNYDADGNVHDIFKRNTSKAGQTHYFGTTPDWLKKMKKDASNRGLPASELRAERTPQNKSTKETSPKTAKSRLKQLRGELAALKQKEDESRPKPPKGFKETYFGVKEGSATFKKLWGHPDYGHGFDFLTGKHDFFYEPKSKSKSKSKPADTGKSIYKVAKKIEKEERRSYQEKYGVTHKEIADLASSEGYYLKSGVFLKKGKNNLKGPYSRPYQYFAKKASQQK